MIFRLLFILLASLFILGAAATVWVFLGDASAGLRTVSGLWDGPVSNDPTPRTFEIKEGQSAADIGRQLEHDGFIRSALLFRLVVESRDLGSRLGRGTYVLRRDMTTAEIAEAIASGPGRVRTFTIPEGWRAAQVAAYLESQGHARTEDFMAVVADPQRIAPFHQLVGEPPSLEGYLFPDTYELEPGSTAPGLAQRMVRQFDRTLGTEIRQKGQERGLSLHQLVTLASIIEREAALPEERRRISGVFHNRLKADMPLQADPTVQYAAANRDLRAAAEYGFWKIELTQEDLDAASPYNTYQVRGLPPGPICSPGMASLAAAADPESTDALYFVSRGDGSHVFARTMDEHVANIQRYSGERQPARR